jgi:hypothetical protein
MIAKPGFVGNLRMGVGLGTGNGRILEERLFSVESSAILACAR